MVTAVFFLTALDALAGNIVFKIKAVNPSGAARIVKTSRYLPAGINPETDVVDPGGMAIKYDPKAAAYYVETTEELLAGQTKDYAVVVKDVWSFPDEMIDSIRAHAISLSGALARTREAQLVADMAKEINGLLSELSDHQKKYATAGSRITEHIQAYERSRDLMKRARTDVALMESIAVGNAIDPRGLFGLPPPLPEKKRDKVIVGEKPLVKRIHVENPSDTARTNTVKVYLPREVLPEDINPGESLQVRYDDELEACYVTRDDVKVGPKQSVDLRTWKPGRQTSRPSPRLPVSRA